MDRNVSVKGLDGIFHRKERFTVISVPPTKKHVSKTSCEVQRLFENPEDAGYDGTKKFLIDWNDIELRKNFGSKCKNRAWPDEYAGYNGLPELALFNDMNFYETRAGSMETLLNDFPRELILDQRHIDKARAARWGTLMQNSYFGGFVLDIFSVKSNLVCGIHRRYTACCRTHCLITQFSKQPALSFATILQEAVR